MKLRVRTALPLIFANFDQLSCSGFEIGFSFETVILAAITFVLVKLRFYRWKTLPKTNGPPFNAATARNCQIFEGVFGFWFHRWVLTTSMMIMTPVVLRKDSDRSAFRQSISRFWIASSLPC